MGWLTVTGSITVPTGKTLAWATLTVTLLEEYSDGTARYPRIYDLAYDTVNGDWKPNGTANGTTAYIPGAAVGDLAPAAQLQEVQRYTDNSEQLRSWTQGLVATSADQWDYTAEPPERWAMGGNYGATLYPAATGRLLRYGAGPPARAWASLGISTSTLRTRGCMAPKPQPVGMATRSSVALAHCSSTRTPRTLPVLPGRSTTTWG